MRADVVTNELLGPGPADALDALLEIEPRSGDELPALWHRVYLLDRPAESDLGADGHPTNGLPSPPAPGQSRMFAGGRVTLRQPLILGVEATRRSSVVATSEKVGRSGPLTFITVRHEISQRGLVALVEEQDIVYRPQARLVANASVDVAPDAITPDFGFGFIVDPIVLFRFSALTYNSHRIHYDRPYAELEGYPDLVIHGPLQVVLMGEALRRAGVSLLGRQFDFRLLAPAFGSQRLDVGASVTPEPGAVASAYVRSADGQLTAQSFVRDVAS